MIRYQRGSFNLRSLCRLRGSVFKRSLLPALLCASLGAFFKYLEVYEIGPLNNTFTDVLTDNSAYSSVSVLIGFLVIFRTQQSYSRFWDGCRYLKEMQAEWFMTGSNLFAFTRSKPTAEPAAVRAFQDVLVRLLSLIHAVALSELHGKESANIQQLMKEAHELGLDDHTHSTIKSHECKVELLVQLLQALTVDAQASGVLTIAPPILSRVFQNMSNGLSAFYSAYRITEVPYPFPYMQATELLLLGHCIVTPLAMCSFTAKPIWSGVFCFLVSIILISLNQIAVELEDPYGTDVNDLNLTEMQQEMNKRLKMLHKHASHSTPSMKITQLADGTRSIITDGFTEEITEDSPVRDLSYFKLITVEDLKYSTNFQALSRIQDGVRSKSLSSNFLSVPLGCDDSRSGPDSPRAPMVNPGRIASKRVPSATSQVSFSEDLSSERSIVKGPTSQITVARPKGPRVVVDEPNVSMGMELDFQPDVDLETEVGAELPMSRLHPSPATQGFNGRCLPHLALLGQAQSSNLQLPGPSIVKTNSDRSRSPSVGGSVASFGSGSQKQSLSPCPRLVTPRLEERMSGQSSLSERAARLQGTSFYDGAGNLLLLCEERSEGMPGSNDRALSPGNGGNLISSTV